MLTLSTRAGRSSRLTKAVRSFGFFLTCLLLTFFSNVSRAQSYDFHQARNAFQGGTTIDWVGGILNATHTDYFEGVGIPQRVVILNIPSTAGNVHAMKFKVLAQKGAIHAYDFLISWEQAVRTAAAIGNGSVNELADLGTVSGTSVTINAQTAWDGALSANAVAASSSLTQSVRIPLPTVGDPSAGGNVAGKITCFESVYGNREMELLLPAGVSVSNTSVTFDGYDAEYAFYTVRWTSSASNVAMRFAGHAAIGVGQTGSGNCVMGYGEGKGAGSISGGPYHFKLLELDGASIGQQDNQLQSGAIQIPPTCGFTGPALACPNTASLTYQYQGSNAANANLTFTFVTNTANATFATNGTALTTLNAVANASGAYTLTVYPRTGGFTAGGDIQVQVSASTNQGNCSQAAGVTHIENVVVTATASPAGPVSLLLAPPHYSLNVSSVTIDGVPAPLASFSYLWSVDPPVGGTLSAYNIQNPTFGATTAGSYTFRVTATQLAAPGCSDFDEVTREIAPGGGCPQVTGGPLCANATGTFTADRDPAAGETWVWSATNGASINAPNGNKSVSVTAGTSNFNLILTINYANTALLPRTCTTAVTVKPRPVGSADNATVCSGDQASITLNSDITGTNFAWTASVTTAPTGGSISGVTASGSGTPIVQTLSNNGTTNGVVTYVVTPTADGCAGTPFNVTITVKPRPVGTPDAKSICSGDNTNVTLSANITSSYSWTASLLSGSASGFSNSTGSSISQVLTNTSSANAVVRYSVTPTANGCAGTPFNVDITVKPRPVGSASPQTICSGAATSVNLNSNVTGTTFTWTAALHTGSVSGFSNSNGATIAQTLTGSGVVRYTVTPTVAGCPGDAFTVDVTVNDCDVFCTYTQGAYGSVGGMSCNGETSYSTYETITRAINAQGGTLRVGIAGKSMTITAGANADATSTSASADVMKTVSVLPGGGQARMFTHPGDITISNIPTSYLNSKSGRINNNLLSQTITLGINLGVKSNLGGLVLKGGTIATAETVNGCGDNTAKTRYCCIDPITLQLTVQNEYRYRDLDADVIASLDVNPANRTVAKLFDLANRALSNTDGSGSTTVKATTEDGVSLTAIMNTVDAINNAFDGCRVLVGFNVAACSSTEPCTLMVQGRAATESVNEVVEGRELKVTAYPNPFNDRIRFTIASPVSGQAQLEVFNMMGQKVATVFNGTVQANRNQVVEYRVPSGAQQNLMYLFRVGDHRATGKLLNTGNR